MSITINGTTNTITAASGLSIAGNVAVTGTLSFGEGGSGGFLGVPIDTGYMRIHGSNAINQGAGIILFGTTSAAPNTGRLTAAASTVAQWTSAGLAVTGTLSASSHILPTIDNTSNLGSAALGMKELFCDNGTINTSDARRKTEVSALSAAEINAAKQLAKEIGSFKFLAAVAEKGDAARLHIGMTVQRAIEIMEANNLDPFAYSLICHDSWEDVFFEHPAIEAVAAQDAVLDDDGNVITPAVEAVEGQEAWTEQTQVAGDKYSFRVHELLLFMAAGFEARLSALEAA